MTVVNDGTARELHVDRGRRRIRVRDAGDPAGSPVVFFHGLGDSRLDLAAFEDTARRLRVRLVSFDRPGYGRSDPAPFTLETVADDAATVGERLGLDRWAAFGQSAGSRFALTTAAAFPDRVVRVGCASGTAPAGSVSEEAEAPDEDAREALSHLPADPPAAAQVYATAFAPLVELVQHGGRREVVAAFAPMLAPPDRELLADDAFAAAVVANAREAARQGVQAFAWDALTFVAPWPFQVQAVTCPVHLWYGEHDTIPLAHARWLAASLPEATLTIWPREGHLAYRSHMEEILDWLRPPLAS